MKYKNSAFPFKSPLKQDEIPNLTDEELEKSRKRMNARADAIEQMKNIGKLPGKADDGMRIYKEGDTIHRNVTFNENDPVQKQWALEMKAVERFLDNNKAKK